MSWMDTHLIDYFPGWKEQEPKTITDEEEQKVLDRMNLNTQDGYNSRLNHLYGELANNINPEIH